MSENTTENTNQTTDTGGGAAPIYDWKGLLADEYKPVIEAKGFKDVNDLMGSYTSLEKMLGTKTVKVPETDAPEEWEKVWNKLGRPEAPEKYSVEGENLEDFKKAAHQVGLTDKQAKGLYDWFKGLTEQQQSSVMEQQKAQEAEMAAKVEAEINELKREWGAAFDENLNIAKRGAKALGWTEEEINALEATIGSKRLLESMRKIGGATLEDTAVAMDGSSLGQLVTSPQQAQMKIDAMFANKEFMARYTNPNVRIRQAAIAEIEPLFKMVAGS